MFKFINKLRGFRDDERGSSTAEFVIVATTFLTGFFWVFETGLIMTKQMMLERALDITVRELRLFASPLYTHDFIKEEICDKALVFNDCSDTLFLEMDRFNPSVGYAKNYKCYDKENDIAPVTTWSPGSRNEIVYIRACIIIDPLMPNGIALFPGTSETGIPLVADTAFVNEPD
ncbi:TadE/TadG family type IV pilus assembly protein [Neptunicoccus sediminis]|uniref:TadE/TadG family type IV pilus assembly protein n=1 Tax=Neptunicoccus sediminis TaxID=1892596 RepID=UPI000845F1E0|nr:TadE/TadG family type IV pilus assembly protein [Neptunicoccus sediminis]